MHSKHTPGLSRSSIVRKEMSLKQLCVAIWTAWPSGIHPKRECSSGKSRTRGHVILSEANAVVVGSNYLLGRKQTKATRRVSFEPMPSSEVSSPYLERSSSPVVAKPRTSARHLVCSRLRMSTRQSKDCETLYLTHREEGSLCHRDLPTNSLK